MAAARTTKSSSTPSAAKSDAAKPAMTKAEAVRQALAKGHVSPTEGTRYIKTEFGLVVPKQQFSVYKSDFKTRAAKAKRKAKASGVLSPPAKPVNTKVSVSISNEPDVMLAFERIKPFVQKYGVANVKKIVDLLG